MLSTRPRYTDWEMAHGISTGPSPYEGPNARASTEISPSSDAGQTLDSPYYSLSKSKLVPASLSPAGHSSRKTASDPATPKANGETISHSGFSPKTSTAAELSDPGSTKQLGRNTDAFQDAFMEDLGDSEKELKIIASLLTMMRDDHADSRFASDIMEKLKGQIESRLARGHAALQKMEQDKLSVRTALDGSVAEN